MQVNSQTRQQRTEVSGLILCADWLSVQVIRTPVTVNEWVECRGLVLWMLLTQ